MTVRNPIDRTTWDFRLRVSLISESIPRFRRYTWQWLLEEHATSPLSPRWIRHAVQFCLLRPVTHTKKGPRL